MKNQDKAKARKNRKRTPWSKLFARSPRVSATITQEHDWETDVPNIRLSRAFVIVLVIHVVAVGGIIAFELMQPNTPTVASSSQGPEDSADVPPVRASSEAGDNANALAAAAAKKTAALAPAPAPAPAPEMPVYSGGSSLKHIVEQGDSVRSILERYGVTRSDLATANGTAFAATQEPFVGQVLTVHNVRNGISAGASVPVMAGDKPRTLSSAPMTALVDPDAPARDFTPENDPGAAPVERRSDGFMPLEGMAESSDDITPTVDIAELNPPVEEVEEITLIDETEVIPSRSSTPKTTTPKVTRAATVAKASNGSNHTVQAGETAYAIGLKYGVSPEKLLKANGINDPSALQIGRVLSIPR